MGTPLGVMTVRKSELDGRVAELLGMETRAVAAVTTLFLDEALRALVAEGNVLLNGLGRMRLIRRTGQKRVVLNTGGPNSKCKDKIMVDVPAKYFIGFTKAPRLTRAIHERYNERTRPYMEKYGVDEEVEQEKLEKAAAEGCPKCGAKVARHGTILVCPNCGTEPFEEKKP